MSATKRMAKQRPRRGTQDDCETPFHVRALIQGRAAVRAYLFSVYGLVPGLGVIFGPVGFLLGVRERWRQRNDPERKDRSLANAAMILGGALWLTTWAGLLLIYLWATQPSS